MQPSQYQLAIIDAITTKSGALAINAVAGSGKSSTLKMVAIALQEKGVNPSDVRVIVFGKANAEELAEKFGEGWEKSVSTLHSAGFSVLKQKLARGQKVKVDGQKYKKIAETQGLLDTRSHKGQIVKTGQLIARGICEHEQPFLKLIDLLRLNNLEPTPDNVFNVINHFDIEGLEVSQRLNADWLCDQIIDVLGQGIDDALPSDSSATAVVDFTDMIWIPVTTKIQPRYRAQYVLIDECQDLNSAQAELALNLVAPGGRVLAVGDPYQAIMGFSGADDSAYQKLVARIGAREMPLSICYRCPKSHIRLVNRIFPAIPIEATDNAIEGIVGNISSVEMEKMLREGDMVLSRTTAPLVGLCLRLLAKEIPATVKGRDIGASLTTCLKDIIKFARENDDAVLASFDTYANEYIQRKSHQWQGKDNSESLMQSLSDKIDAISFILEKQDCRTLQEFGDFVESLFSDGHSPITLCTVHRAKGLESERVFIISPEKLPLKKAVIPWQLQQERNLHYVALTRSKKELYIVRGKKISLTEEVINKLFAPQSVADAVAETMTQPVAETMTQPVAETMTQPVAETMTNEIIIPVRGKLPKSIKPSWANVGKYEQLAEAAHRMGAYKCARKWSQYAEAIMAVLFEDVLEVVSDSAFDTELNPATKPDIKVVVEKPIDLSPAEEKKAAKAVKQEWRKLSEKEGSMPSRILELPLPDWWWLGEKDNHALRRAKSVPINVINQAIMEMAELKTEKAKNIRWEAVTNFCKHDRQERPMGARGTMPTEWIEGEDAFWIYWEKEKRAEEKADLQLAMGMV